MHTPLNYKVKTKQDLLHVAWWPGMDRGVENMIKDCGECLMDDKALTQCAADGFPPDGFRHEPCKGAAGTDETAQLLRVRVSGRVQPSISPVENAALTSLLTKIVTRELSHCVLVLLWDEVYARTPLIDTLVHLPNPKQVVEVSDVKKLGQLLWRAEQCRGYLLLLKDASALMHLAEHTPHDAWDYSGKFVVAGLSIIQLDAFTQTTTGRKTEHIVGIVQVCPKMQFTLD
ncbi:hypothetical protein O3P69_008819 [Scylla paramamosain]|uniref:Uncharacterized protein n=1 Tax=Scylla paramamosain TaxID=85552 RepID=A0AAW0TNS1_SCYPA